MIRNLAAAYCVAFQNYKADIMSTVHSQEVVPASIARITEAVVVREVAALWPNLFGPGVFVPLKIGIDKILAIDAQRRGSALTGAKIRLFLGWHVRRAPYLEAVQQGGPRHSINGAAENARTVTMANAAYAQEKLQALLKRNDAPSAEDLDGEEGMAWWNGLDRRERAKWMKAAGDTGVAADAWYAFKIALGALSENAGRG